MNLGEAIRITRQKAFYTQEDFSKRLNVALSTVNRWELNKAKPNVKAMKESDGQSDWQGPRPPFLLDGAHNPHGMATLAKALKEGMVPMPACVVFSCLADKDWKSVLALLAPCFPNRMLCFARLQITHFLL